MSDPVAPSPVRRVFLVEDHPVMREGYAALIAAEPDMEVCAEAASAEEAFDVATGLAFDVAVVDLSLPGTNGLEFIRRLLAVDPAARCLVVSSHDEAIYAERALRAGARGYLMKDASARELVEAVRAVLDGDLHVSGEVQARLVAQHLQGGATDRGPVDFLSDRELEVYEQYGRGKGTREVAEALGLAVKTVESHRTNVMAKLGLRDFREFARRAVLWVAGPVNGT